MAATEDVIHGSVGYLNTVQGDLIVLLTASPFNLRLGGKKGVSALSVPIKDQLNLGQHFSTVYSQILSVLSHYHTQKWMSVSSP